MQVSDGATPVFALDFVGITVISSRRGLCRFGGYVGNSDTQGNMLQHSVQTRISRVRSNVNSCPYTHSLSNITHQPTLPPPRVLGSGDFLKNCWQ